MNTRLGTVNDRSSGANCPTDVTVNRLRRLGQQPLAIAVTSVAIAMLLMTHPPTSDAKGSSFHSHANSDHSDSGSRSRHSLNLSNPNGRAYTSREMRTRILSGNIKGVHTMSGNPLVLRNDRGQTFVNGTLWHPAPTPVVSTMRVNGRLTPYYVQPTRIVQSGRYLVLNDGPRYASQRYWQTEEEAQRDEFWWSYFCASNDLYEWHHPFGWYTPFSPAWLGHEAGLEQRAQRFPQTAVVADTQFSVPGTNQEMLCSYEALDGTPFANTIPVWTIDGICPSHTHPPSDARYPGAVIFCNVKDPTGSALTVPIHATICPQEPPPPETSDDDLTTDP